MLGIFQESVTDILRTMSNGLRIPVMVILILLAGLTLILLGSLIAEVFREHKYLKEEMPVMVDKIQAASMEDLPRVIKEGQLLQRQKTALLELTKHPKLTPLMRESLAIRLIAQERDFYDKRTRRTDLIAKIGPMMGLMGTLIPLGPGIIALGQGDTYTLSTSLLMAFDTTVAGLACAAVALVISSVRKRWYKDYISMTETMMECMLEAINLQDKSEAKNDSAAQTVKCDADQTGEKAAGQAGSEQPDAANTVREEAVKVYREAYQRAVKAGKPQEEALEFAKSEGERFLKTARESR